jgi:hypothetical protein
MQQQVEGDEKRATELKDGMSDHLMMTSPFNAIPYPFFSDIEFKVLVGVLWGLSDSLLIFNILEAVHWGFYTRRAHQQTLWMWSGPSGGMVLSLINLSSDTRGFGSRPARSQVQAPE